MAEDRPDVVVVGGGPAGAAAAILFRRQGFVVTLLEKGHMPRPKPCGEALSPEATPLLDRLGALAAVRSGPHGLLRGFEIYPYGQAPFRGTYAARGGADPARAVGLTVPRLVLDTVLLETARRAGVAVREGWSVRSVGPFEDGVRMIGGVGPEGRPFSLRAPLLIAADGVHSTVARRLNLALPSTRLRQIAIVAQMRGVTNIGGYGEMHVAPRGYAGVAPGHDDLANVSIVAPRAEGAYLGGGPSSVKEYFLSRLATFPWLGDRLSEAGIVAGPWTTSGLAGRVRRRVDDGLILVGDAGGYYDPFTGEGIYRGMRGAELAAQVGGPALARGEVRAHDLSPYAWKYQTEFAPKRLVEIIVHEVTTRRPLFEHIGARLRRRRHLADALLGVTGDFISPYEVLSPWYLARLLL
ncbi:MAG TPA: NAD(P)/FAD-dependent oxidoreductase [Chloroflexota bacterium]|nr:NAD(P)/FAD-dependent oxidoreductase [Chloroflexota bacterium]